MKNTEIAERLAKAMGWEISDRLDMMNPASFMRDGNQIYARHLKAFFAPAIRWDHIGIVIDWMEAQGNPIHIEENKSSRRIRFGETEGVTQTYGGSLPHQICLAALEALA